MGDSSPTGTADGDSLRTLGGAQDRRRDEHPSAIGRFRIVRVLGAGGMGFVYVGHDEQLRRDVAIKMLRSERDSPSARQRLEREAHALAQLSHPNVVPVFEVGEHDGRRFLAMELVEGDNLREWLRRGARSWREIVDAYVQAARGLAAAHARGLVHRDFKPENALIADDGEGTPMRVRVVDFGVVAEADATTASVPVSDMEWDDDGLHTRTGEFLGTPRYMAPEQFVGVGVGPQTDQFAWCVAVYEALSGARPFAGGSASELATAVTTSSAAPLPAGAYPRALAAVLARGLAREPGNRFASMNELVAAVSAATSMRRRRWPWIAGAVATASVVVVWSAWPDPPEAKEDVVAPAVIVAELGGPPTEAQARAKEPFARGHAALERGEYELAMRSFDAAALPLERAQEIGEDIARIQLDRGLAYLAAWKAEGVADHLVIAHELLRRSSANEYRHPEPAELQRVAEAALAELDEAALTQARGTPDPARRFYLLSLVEYPRGTRVDVGDRLFCHAPCTIPLPVNEPTFVHLSHPEFIDIQMISRPYDHIAGSLPLQPMVRLREGQTYIPALDLSAKVRQ